LKTSTEKITKKNVNFLNPFLKVSFLNRGR